MNKDEEKDLRKSEETNIIHSKGSQIVKFANDEDSKTNNKKFPTEQQTHDPFHRLVNTPTLAAVAKRLGSPPVDSLDMALSSVYDHHGQWCAPKWYIARQKYPCIHLKRREEIEEQKRSVFREHDTRKELKFPLKNVYRDEFDHIKIKIDSSHNANTARGYGRSHEGIFYSL